MDDLRRTPLSPCGSHAYAATDFDLRELESVTKLRVQALRNRGLRTSVADPLRLPASPNTAAGSDPVALWRSPDDWLIYSRALAADALGDWVSSIECSVPLYVTDVSSASAVFELRGARVVDILMRDCTLDLEGGAIPAEGCAQTLFAQTSVMIHRPLYSDTWRMFVDRSVTRHVWEWLVDTAGRVSGTSC